MYKIFVIASFVFVSVVSNASANISNPTMIDAKDSIGFTKSGSVRTNAVPEDTFSLPNDMDLIHSVTKTPSSSCPRADKN